MGAALNGAALFRYSAKISQQQRKRRSKPEIGLIFF